MNTTERPWIILNAAMTADGKIDTFTRQGAKISSDSDWARVDQLRAQVDAVMVGGQTLTGEDPRLTVKSAELRRQRRREGRPENPAKVGIISNASLNLNGKFINDGSSTAYLFTTWQTPYEQVEKLQENGASVYIDHTRRVDLVRAMRQLKSEGIDQVLIEGGGTLNAAMFSAGLIDEVRVYIAPLIFGGANAPTLADGLGLSREDAVQLELKSAETLADGGVLITYFVKHLNHKGEYYGSLKNENPRIDEQKSFARM